MFFVKNDNDYMYTSNLIILLWPYALKKEMKIVDFSEWLNSYKAHLHSTITRFVTKMEIELFCCQLLGNFG